MTVGITHCVCVNLSRLIERKNAFPSAIFGMMSPHLNVRQPCGDETLVTERYFCMIGYVSIAENYLLSRKIKFRMV